MINKFNLKNNNHFKRFCQPIYDYFNVSHFWYHSISNDGHYTCLGSHQAWTEYYFSEKLYLCNPYLRAADNYSTGINFIRKIEDEGYQESVDIGIKQFNLNQSLLFLEKSENGVIGYGFACQSTMKKFEELCVNELPLLKLFINRFNEEFGPLIKKMEEQPVNMSSLIGPSFYKKTAHTSLMHIDKGPFLKAMKFPNVSSLSKRELSLLKYIGKGYSAVQIADRLFLSKRTIEHYIENIKNKLKGTESKMIFDFFSVPFKRSGFRYNWRGDILKCIGLI